METKQYETWNSDEKSLNSDEKSLFDFLVSFTNSLVKLSVQYISGSYWIKQKRDFLDRTNMRICWTGPEKDLV